MNEYSSLSDCKISLPVKNYPLKTLRKYSTIHKYTTINQLLDKCLIELFKRLDITDLLSVRLVNSRFNKIIQRNFNRLAKKEVKVLKIIETPSGKFMRYGLRTFSSNVERFFGELHIDKLNKPLRHMRCLNISVEYANLSDQLLLELQRCIRNSVQTLELNYSSLCAVSNYNFDPLTMLNITDQTLLDCWRAKLCWPRIFVLKNVQCPSITSTSLACLIEKVVHTKPHISGNLMWNFGVAFSFPRHDFDQKISQLQDLVVDYKLLSSGTLFVKFKIKPAKNFYICELNF
uniref:F-box domain-containing protein n=1 Tax=Ditylenchus dipsaci TaxID=166011 RepID=A0A915E0U3_9BILA